MASFFQKNHLKFIERSASISEKPEINLLKKYNITDKIHLIRDQVKRFTSNEKMNNFNFMNSKIEKNNIYMKQKTMNNVISRNNNEFKINYSSLENDNTVYSTLKNSNDSNLILNTISRTDEKKHSFFKPIQTSFKKYTIFSKKVKIDLKKNCIKNVIERNLREKKHITFEKIKEKVLKNYTPNLTSKEISIITEPNDIKNNENDFKNYTNFNSFERNEKLLNTFVSPKRSKKNNLSFLKFKSEKELKTFTSLIKNKNNKRFSIDFSKFQKTNLDDYFFKKEVKKTGKIKAMRELKAISNILTEYEELNIDKGTYSKQNLNRIVELLKLKSFHFNEEEMNNIKEINIDKFDYNTEEGCYVINAISHLGPPPFLKTKFKSSTISKYNDSIGLGFGSYRNKDGKEYRKKIHNLKYKVD